MSEKVTKDREKLSSIDLINFELSKCGLSNIELCNSFILHLNGPVHQST